MPHTKRRFHKRRVRSTLVALSVVIVLIASGCDYVYGPFLGRLDQPVVLTGADLPEAVGLDPTRATLWRYDEGWVQVPVG